MTILDEMTKIGFHRGILRALPAKLQQSLAQFSDWTADSECGERCKKILSLSAPVLEDIDPIGGGIDVGQCDIWRGIITAMSVVCLS